MSGEPVCGATVEVVAPLAAEVGEGPVWLPDTSELQWVDMAPGLLHRTAFRAQAAAGDSRTDSGAYTATTTRSLGTFLGAVVPRVGGGQVAATGMGFAQIDADGTLSERAHVLDRAHRMNDAKCDPSGCLWSGSAAYDFAVGGGGLHILEPDWSSRLLLEGLTLPNGMGWSPDGRTFYLADSVTHELFAFDVAPSGSLSGRRILHTFTNADGMPDGLCVDNAGCLWVALWGGGAIAQIGPDGRRLRDVCMPAAQISSCAFGGPAYDVLFVTSAASGLHTPTPLDGAVFAIHGLGATGLPCVPFAG